MRPPNKNSASYETRDVSFFALLILIGMLLILLGGAMIACRGMDRFFARFSPLHDAPKSAVADLRPLPPEPRLQVNPPVDLIRLRDIENVRLNNYSWVDPAAGKVRIPITRAMAIVAKQNSHE